MSKKMKGVVLDSSSYGVHGYAKKHQSLLQDYQDLTKDVETSRNKLDNLKRRKMALMAEVGFLRRRYKYLLKNKSQKLPQEREKEFEQPHNRKNSTGYPNVKGKQAALQKPNPVPKPSQKRKVYNAHDNSFHNVNLSYDPNHKEKQHTDKTATHINPVQNSKPRGRLYTTEEVIHQNPMPVFDLNQQEQMYYKNDAAMGNPSLIFNSYQKESASSSVKQPPMQTRALVFDLNQISWEIEESRHYYKHLRFEESGKGLNDKDQLGDMKLAVCGSVVGGYAKRKISCQDSVDSRSRYIVLQLKGPGFAKRKEQWKTTF